MTMAISAVNSPTRNTMTAGIRKTKIGMVCSVSQIGADNRRDAVVQRRPDADRRAEQERDQHADRGQLHGDHGVRPRARDQDERAGSKPRAAAMRRAAGASRRCATRSAAMAGHGMPVVPK